MASDSSTTSRTESPPTTTAPLRRVGLVVGRILTDFVVLGLWVFFLTLLFLSTGWPRWSFYALLILGVIGYVLITPTWAAGDTSTE